MFVLIKNVQKQQIDSIEELCNALIRITIMMFAIEYKPSACLLSTSPRDARLHTQLIETFKEHQKALLSFFQARTSVFANSDDLLQELFIKISSVERDAEIRYPKAYLFRIANNLIIDTHRKSFQHTVKGCEDIENIPSEISPERELQARQRMVTISQALRKLPNKTQHVFYQVKIENVSKADVAESLGISVNMVEKHLRRALQYCKMQIYDSEN